MEQESLFDDLPPSAPKSSTQIGIAPESSARVVRVIADEPAITREFDYLVPGSWEAKLEVGTPVRIQLQGRRIRAWVTALDVDPQPGLRLQTLIRHNGVGPDAEILELARWAAHRWAGRVPTLLRVASPATQLKDIPAAPPPRSVAAGLDNDLVASAIEHGGASLIRCPPHTNELAVVRQLARLGQLLVVVPTASRAREIRAGATRNGLDLGLLPRDWAKGAAGGSAIGPRSAVWARMPALAAVLVVDAHDESLQSEQTPTWNARDVAIERARRAGVPCVLLSPVPDLATLKSAPLLAPSRQAERAGWPVTEIVDRRGDAPGAGSLLSARLAEIVRGDESVVCVLNRKGRAQLLRCAVCDALVVCEICASALQQHVELLECRACGHSRPQVCAECDSTKLKRLRPGVSRIAEELAALSRRDVTEVTADSPMPAKDAKLLVGTEAILHRVPQADVVVFLDIDSELLAPRYRAVEQTMALLARAARLLGGRGNAGRLVIQTRQPGHVAIQSVLLADPGRVAEAELAQREQFMLPPFRAMAQISGSVAQGYVEELEKIADLEVQGPADGAWLVLAESAKLLSDRLASVQRPSGRMRIAVDPLRA